MSSVMNVERFEIEPGYDISRAGRRLLRSRARPEGRHGRIVRYDLNDPGT